MLAGREGLRSHEVPVDWVDDPDSRVDIVRTARDDLRGIARLLAGARLTRILGTCAAGSSLAAPGVRCGPPSTRSRGPGG